MRSLLGVVVVLAACSESTADRLDQFKADAAVSCWEYSGCASRSGLGYAPSVAIEQGVACMNEALTSGSRATASWGVEDTQDSYGFHSTFVFTVDHQIKVFTSFTYPEQAPQVHELPTCAGPFRIAEESLCAYGTRAVSVNALTWDGCP